MRFKLQARFLRAAGQQANLRPQPRSRRTAQQQIRNFTVSGWRRKSDDPRIRELGRQISDDYAHIRDHYATPRYPLVLAHGLLGFSELPLPGRLGTISYWHGIAPALAANSIRHVTTAVPPSHSIEDRAAALAEGIRRQCTDGAPVNIVAHSMGGLDARYMISVLRPKDVDVRSLVTVATPHRGSAFADYVLGGLYQQRGNNKRKHLAAVAQEGQGATAAAAKEEEEVMREKEEEAELEEGGVEAEKLGWWDLRNLYGAIERMGLGTDAFAQLTRRHMAEFNTRVPDDASVRYFSYGAAMDAAPPLMSPFRLLHRIIAEAEGPNDGLVSVESSRWGAYKGTLVGVSHLDLINWSNRVRWTIRRWMGREKGFNAVAFYLDIAEMLAKEGL